MKCVPQVLDIKAKAKIMFRLTLSTTYEKRSADIHIGDFIDGLIYQDGDNLKEVSGVVRSINTFERSLPRSAYGSPDYISLRNIIESITLDVSDKYSSELLTVDIVDIRNYDMVIHNILEIRNFEIIDKNLIRFYSETKPIAFVWNDKAYPVVPVETMDFTYMVTIDSMQMINILTIFDDSGSIYKRVINGPGMDVVDERDVREDMKHIMGIFKTQFFNNYNATDLTEMIGNMVYTPIVKNIDNVESFIMNGITYYVDELPNVEVMIPNRDADVHRESTANMYPFKIIDNNFCICVPIINHFTDENGVLSMTVNGYEQSWMVCPHKNNNLDIKEIVSVNVLNGYNASFNTNTDYYGLYNIDFNRTHMNTYPNIYYSSKHSNILNNGIICIAFSEDGGWTYKYRLVCLDDLKDRQSDESIYIPRAYVENYPVSVNEKHRFEYNVYVFGEGNIKFSITLTDTIK